METGQKYDTNYSFSFVMNKSLGRTDIPFGRIIIAEKRPVFFLFGDGRHEFFRSHSLLYHLPLYHNLIFPHFGFLNTKYRYHYHCNNLCEKAI